MEIMKYLVEFVGTFIFLAVILTQGKPIPIAVALLAVIYFGGVISGGHFNPAVSIMMFFKKALPTIDLPFYIIAQILGGLLALQFFNFTTTAVAPPIVV
tara:strand:- start:407 stop:703 length:297 start_codon:yes stop_codon:yes gene_type:complete